MNIVDQEKQYREVNKAIRKDCQIIASKSLDVAKNLWRMERDELWQGGGFRSFREYIDDIKQHSRDYMYRLLKAGRLAGYISNADGTGGILPSSEWQLRPLVPLLDSGTPEEVEQAVVEVWSNAVEAADGEAPSYSEVETAMREKAARPNGSRRRYSERERELKEHLEGGWAVVANLQSDHALISWATEQQLFVRVDRATCWGNPFLLDKDGDRDAVCDAYGKFYLPHKPSLLRRIGELSGKVLGCHCAPERCHADELARLANED